MQFFTFFFYCSCHHRDLHSFPTRRSSDLINPFHELEREIEDFDALHQLAAEEKNESHRAQADREVLSEHDRLVHKLEDRKSTRLNSSHITNSYAVFCLKKKKIEQTTLSNT